MIYRTFHVFVQECHFCKGIIFGFVSLESRLLRFSSSICRFLFTKRFNSLNWPEIFAELYQHESISMFLRRAFDCWLFCLKYSFEEQKTRQKNRFSSIIEILSSNDLNIHAWKTLSCLNKLLKTTVLTTSAIPGVLKTDFSRPLTHVQNRLF